MSRPRSRHTVGGSLRNTFSRERQGVATILYWRRRPTQRMKKRWFAVAAFVAFAIVVLPRMIRYQRVNMETLDLDDQFRAKAPGSFVRLPLGYLHYELAGPADRLPVL